MVSAGNVRMIDHGQELEVGTTCPVTKLDSVRTYALIECDGLSKG